MPLVTTTERHVYHIDENRLISVKVNRNYLREAHPGTIDQSPALGSETFYVPRAAAAASARRAPQDIFLYRLTGVSLLTECPDRRLLIV